MATAFRWWFTTDLVTKSWKLHHHQTSSILSTVTLLLDGWRDTWPALHRRAYFYSTCFQVVGVPDNQRSQTRNHILNKRCPKPSSKFFQLWPRRGFQREDSSRWRHRRRLPPRRRVGTAWLTTTTRRQAQAAQAIARPTENSKDPVANSCCLWNLLNTLW